MSSTTKVSHRTMGTLTNLFSTVFTDEYPTTKELSDIVGRTPSTVRVALAKIGATPVDESLPTRWKLPSNRQTIEREAPSEFDEVVVKVSTKDVENIIQMWNDSKDALGQAITSLEIVPELTPSALATRLGTISGAIALLSSKIAEHQSKPDWYEILTESN